MKKIMALMLAGVMTASALAGCGSGGNKESKAEEPAAAARATADSADDDWTYLQNKGAITIGITYFEPMNYKDADGKLTGFDTEFAEAVCTELGLTPVFQEIDWDSKELELSSKTIDCIWNGFTITPERQEKMDVTEPYMENKQVMVCKRENVEKYSVAFGLRSANVVAEAGSAGAEVTASDPFFDDASCGTVASQSTALLEVKTGAADVAVIDHIMSLAALKDGSGFEELAVVGEQSFAPGQYGVALRKNSGATLAKLNEAIRSVAGSGKLREIAEKYDLTDYLLPKSE